jgi:thioester reductase-like protein
MGGVTSFLSAESESPDAKYFASFLGRKDSYFIYGCNECAKAIDGDRFTCPECLNYDLCESCNRIKNHEHDLYLETSHPQKLIDILSQSPSAGQAILKAFDLYAHRYAFGYRSETSLSGASSSSDTPSLPPYRWITFKETGKRVHDIGNGLRALIPPRTFVGICSRVQLAWYLADYACQVHSMIGPVIGPNYAVEHIEHIVQTTGIKLVFASASLLPLFLAVAAKCPSLEYIIQLESLDSHLIHPELANARATLQHWIVSNVSPISNADFSLMYAFHPASTGSMGPLHPCQDFLARPPRLSAIQVQNWKNTVSRISRPAVLDISDLELLGACMEDPEVYITKPEELETLVYTSGSTGVPKGAMFSGASWRAQVCPTQASSTIEKVISWSVSDRMNDIRHLCLGSAVAIYNGEMAQIFSDLAEVRPHQMNATPAFWNKIYAEFKAKYELRTAHLKKSSKAPSARERDTEKERLALNGLGEREDEELEMERRRIRKEVLKSFSGLLGGRCVRIVTGGAPTSEEVISFLWDCFNCRVAESYGTTESGGISTAGRFVKGLKWKLVAWESYHPEDKPYPRGELCVKRENMMMEGYFKNPSETAEILDSEGFYHTGDIVQLSPLGDGASIIDRKKNIFKLSQGEWIAPARIEKILLGFCPFIRQIFVYGHPLQSSLVAIIVPHLDRLKDHLRRHQDPQEERVDFLENSQICLLPSASEFLLTECARIGHSQHLRPFEIPAAIHLSELEFSVENGLHTQSEKPSRHALAKRFSNEIEAMYTSIHSKRAQVKQLISEIFASSIPHPDSSSTSSDSDSTPKASSSRNGDSEKQAKAMESSSFIQLGGDSLSAIKLRNLIKRQLNVTIPVQLLLNEGTSIDTITNFISTPFQEVLPNLPSHLDIKEVRRIASLDPSWRSPQLETSIDELNKGPVFLTGCPGFVGTAILCDLLNTGDSDLYVLMRPRPHQSTQNELFQYLRDRVLQSGLVSDSLMSSFESVFQQRVRVVLGALDLPLFGLDEKQFGNLSELIETLIHAGAQVNSVMPYQRLAASNVDGTRTCIELCGRGKSKFLVFVSTTSVLSAAGTYDESKLVPIDLSLMSGYTASKYIAELMVWQAIGQGFNATIVRPAFVGSAYKSGFSNTNDFDNRLLIGMAQERKAPASRSKMSSSQLPYYPLNTFPVDSLARVIVEIARNPKQTTSKCFNLENGSSTLSVQDMVHSLLKYAYKIEETPYGIWKDVEWDESNPIFTMKEEFFSQPSFPIRSPHCSAKNAESFMAENSMASIPPTDSPFVERWISWLMSHNHLHPPQLPSE